MVDLGSSLCMACRCMACVVRGLGGTFALRRVRVRWMEGRINPESVST